MDIDTVVGWFWFLVSGTQTGPQWTSTHQRTIHWMHLITNVGRFSNADTGLDPVLKMRTDWHFLMWEPEWKPTSGFQMTENRLWEQVQMYTFLGAPDRFSHRTQIRFSEFAVSFIGSSCSTSHMGLLLFSCCYYFFPHTAITFLPLLFFSLYYYYSSFYCYYFSPIFTVLSLLVLLFSLLLLLFSHCSYSFPVAVTFLTWCRSLRVMKSFNY